MFVGLYNREKERQKRVKGRKREVFLSSTVKSHTQYLQHLKHCAINKVWSSIKWMLVKLQP